ncbi:MAG: inositol monophosphatase family protein, partial [Alphaproteobacteria bacterium]|nr:inositol monophosphatase family protein [Alphaproteobacteria bacterium]
MQQIIVPPAYIDLANQLADAAGQVIRPYFRTNAANEAKADKSPVTIADKKAEEVMRKLILAADPGFGVVGEEYGAQNSGADWQWILDPIDGTKAFMVGKPTFGTLIGLAYQGQFVLGIIDQPINNERWLGIEGQPSTFNGQQVRTSTTSTLDEAKLSTTGIFYRNPARQQQFFNLHGRCRMTSFGGNCYGFGLLANGCIDLVSEGPGMQVYDYAALVPIIRGAGGIITDWDGQPLT